MSMLLSFCILIEVRNGIISNTISILTVSLEISDAHIHTHMHTTRYTMHTSLYKTLNRSPVHKVMKTFNKQASSNNSLQIRITTQKPVSTAQDHYTSICIANLST